MISKQAVNEFPQFIKQMKNDKVFIVNFLLFPVFINNAKESKHSKTSQKLLSMENTVSIFLMVYLLPIRDLPKSFLLPPSHHHKLFASPRHLKHPLLLPLSLSNLRLSGPLLLVQYIQHMYLRPNLLSPHPLVHLPTLPPVGATHLQVCGNS